MLDWLADPSAWIALLTLTVLEIVLGIDNIVFISILSNKLPASERNKARQMGLGLALISRILLLLSINWVKGATAPIFILPFGNEEASHVSLRDLILGLGGIFLIWKSVKEIHAKLEGEEGHGEVKTKATLSAILAQIMVLDVVFSLDSVITAVGMANQVGVMILAVVIAVAFMLFFSGKISDFVEKHPTVKMLALSFLVLIGVNLIAESSGGHIEKGYTYFAMAFAVGVEMLNIRARNGKPVHLKKGTSYGNPE